MTDMSNPTWVEVDEADEEFDVIIRIKQLDGSTVQMALYVREEMSVEDFARMLREIADEFESGEAERIG